MYIIVVVIIYYTIIITIDIFLINLILFMNQKVGNSRMVVIKGNANQFLAAVIFISCFPRQNHIFTTFV